MTKDDRKLCFVVMGFGEKTDYESGRKLNLDATYESIIEPTVKALGLRCVRANEIMQSGIIDTDMYRMLLQADLVIADISTANGNALYELGVRHALRPHSTIVLKECEGKFIFDLNHTRTLQYQHLGADIGFKEVQRMRAELGKFISASLDAPQPDSPVYTYLPGLQQPRLSKQQFAQLIDKTEERLERFMDLVQAGQRASKRSDHTAAAAAFAQADQIKPDEPYIVQQLALATYKTGRPTEREALEIGLHLIGRLDPEQSHDPETLGIAGAIHKRIWQMDGTRENLDTAIRLYGRGFELRRDYYTGENFALCCDVRSARQSDPREACYDRMSGRKAREILIAQLGALERSEVFGERSDRHWIYATLANSHLALGNREEAAGYEAKFRVMATVDWEIKTYETGKRSLLEILAAKSARPTVPGVDAGAPDVAKMRAKIRQTQGSNRTQAKKTTAPAGERREKYTPPTRVAKTSATRVDSAAKNPLQVTTKTATKSAKKRLGKAPVRGGRTAGP